MVGNKKKKKNTFDSIGNEFWFYAPFGYFFLIEAVLLVFQRQNSEGEVSFVSLHNRKTAGVCCQCQLFSQELQSFRLLPKQQTSFRWYTICK